MQGQFAVGGNFFFLPLTPCPSFKNGDISLKLLSANLPLSVHMHKKFRGILIKIQWGSQSRVSGDPSNLRATSTWGKFFFQLFLPLTSCHHSKNGDILVKPFDSSAPTIRAHAQEVSWDFDQNVVGLPVKVFWGTPQIYQPPPLGGFPVLMHSIEKSCFFGASG